MAELEPTFDELATWSSVDFDKEYDGKPEQIRLRKGLKNQCGNGFFFKDRKFPQKENLLEVARRMFSVVFSRDFFIMIVS
jgi:hypothetical protein